jgi:lathosterol oxidase
MNVILVFLIMSLFLIIRYFAASGFFHYFFPSSKKTQIKRDIRRSIESSVVFAMMITVVIWGLQTNKTSIYFDLDHFPTWYGPLSLFLFLGLQDTYFYWSHRLMHMVYFKQIHFAHHESRNPSAWTSFAFHPVEAFIQAIFLPAFLFTVPIHPYYLISGLMVMTLFGITNHLEKEIYPELLEEKLFMITSTHHQKHHKYVNKNFGLFFTFWDLVMRTEDKR